MSSAAVGSVTFSGSTTNGCWFADPAGLPVATNPFVATAIHPSGLYQVSATDTFRVLVGKAVTNSCDAAGNEIDRAFTLVHLVRKPV